ncbi:MAG: hypothetical protein KA831_00145 [Pyrinomonadaceae bacterium]|nr:hypothetical protein [Pyrinomonadaceae bacterium]
MNRLLVILATITAIAYCFIAMPEGAIAIVIVAVLSVGMILVIRKVDDDVPFLTNLFVTALLIRLLLAAIINIFDLFDFFGPDARGYVEIGRIISSVWSGTMDASTPTTRFLMRIGGPGWGMNYFSGVLYWAFGPNMLVGQAVSSFFGAATVPTIYWCAKSVFGNQRVSRYSAICIAFFPSMIVWSSQFLKDGFIIFFLILTMMMVLEIQKKLNPTSAALLIFSLLAILSLRFYVFYMVAAAVFGSIVIGLGTTTSSILRRVLVVLIVSGAFMYLGLVQTATSDFNRFASIERFENSRKWASDVAGSGFTDSSDANVGTVTGALTVFPVGLAYLMLAPFPWQVSNFRQATTLPEVFLWWGMLPFAVIGLVYTVRHRLRPAVPILIFSTLLTVVYALFQGNVGTAYRQRTQIQVFLLIFISVGWALYREKQENRKFLRIANEKRRFAQFGGRVENGSRI